MLNVSSYSVRRSFKTLSAIATLSIMLLALTTPAQSDGGLNSDSSDPGTRGRNTISGRIYFPSGQGVDRRLRVRLSSVSSGEFSTMSDDNGAFIFRHLTSGTYRLSIEAGKEYEPVEETVDIFGTQDRERRGMAGETITVHIQLRPKQQTASKPSTLNAALAAIPRPARELYEKALVSVKANDHKQAVKLLEEAVSIYPEFALALNELGVQLLILEQIDKAAEAFRSAIKIAPDAFDPRFNHAVVLLQQKKYAEAEAELQRALKINAYSAPAHLYRGRVLIHLRRYDDAERELKRAIELGGEQNIAHRYLGAIYIERGDNKRAIAELEEYLRLSPQVKDADQIREIIKQLRGQ